MNVTFRWIRNHLPQCPLGAGVVCCLPTCVQGSPVLAGAGFLWSGLFLVALVLVLLGRCVFVSGRVLRMRCRANFVPVVLGGAPKGQVLAGFVGVHGLVALFSRYARSLGVDCPVSVAMTRVWWLNLAWHTEGKAGKSIMRPTSHHWRFLCESNPSYKILGADALASLDWSGWASLG